jgi:hypothetical protein
MNNFRSVLIFSVLSLTAFFYSCDDSGIQSPFHNTGVINLTTVNLKPLNQSVDGIYELWMYFDSAAPSWENAGRFNVTGSGEIVSESGGSMSFSLGADTNRMSHLTVCLVSIEGPGINNPAPSSSHLIASAISSPNFYGDSISALLTMSDVNALSQAGSVFLSDTGRGLFFLISPSTNNANCAQGIWLCDLMGQPSMPLELNLDPNGGWFYKMWIIDNITTTTYIVGKFTSLNAADSDGAGPCKGPGNGLNAPGQDFIQTGGGCPDLPNLSDEHHGVFITLEPNCRTDYSQPFFLRVYQNALISIGCGIGDMAKRDMHLLPYARVRISRIR